MFTISEIGVPGGYFLRQNQSNSEHFFILIINMTLKTKNDLKKKKKITYLLHIEILKTLKMLTGTGNNSIKKI